LQGLQLLRPFLQLYQREFKRFLHLAAICSSQGILRRKNPASPKGSVLSGVNVVELIAKLIPQNG
jgi:hypothetical protein